ncbi:MAG: aspartate aminotransferase family protein [Proteobacteria bacterium]|jgi:4-aminobutyrate aminotransferase|nr:aspartate aminotransferase family protein [Pseudomonadota bacterium]
MDRPRRSRPLTDLAAEGDVNLSPLRRQWEAGHLAPATRELLAADARYFLHQSLSTPCFNALRSASGIWLEDVEGRRYMDFHGNSVHQVGYGHPRVVEAVKRALDTLPFSPRRFTNDAAIALAKRLAELAPGDLGKVLFAPGGTSAIGMALKLARLATGRHKTISMWDAFHGASLDAISIGGEALFRRDMGPLLPGTEHVPPCDPRQCRFGCSGICDARCADYVDYVLGKEEDVAAVIVETVRSTDVQIPPQRYYTRLREACDRHGALLILDEIPICLGRTGAMFAFERYGIVPDIVVLGKGLGGAVFPMAAVIAREGLDVAAERALGHYTHEKSSIGCAAALATLDVIADERLCERASELGARALSRLQAMRQRLPQVGDVRGAGLLLAVELVDPASGAAAPALTERVLYRCLAEGLSFKVGQGNVVVLSPPLVIAESDLDRALDIVESAIASAA